ncbi:signal peptidase I [Peterkaempfera bronchialis]|uniref:signal peptidase I n=1 Tax=Peterkaempfera bronchialis TaxID=2126346 RepID=UPI003C2ED15D
MRRLRGLGRTTPAEPGPPRGPRSAPAGRARVLRTAGHALLLLAATAAGALALALTLLPLAVHGSVLTVLTGSMAPTIPPGSVVVDRPVPPELIRTGDIVTFRAGRSPGGGEQLVTHRVVAVHSSRVGLSFTTKGDANRVDDPGRRDASDVRGRVWFHLPQVGLWRQRLLSRAGALVVGGLALGAWGARTLAWALRPGEGADSDPDSDADGGPGRDPAGGPAGDRGGEPQRPAPRRPGRRAHGIVEWDGGA